MARYKCLYCQHVVFEDSILYTSDSEEHTVCSNCDEIDSLMHICDKDGCLDEAVHGYPIKLGFKWTCKNHYCPEEISIEF